MFSQTQQNSSYVWVGGVLLGVTDHIQCEATLGQIAPELGWFWFIFLCLEHVGANRRSVTLGHFVNLVVL